MFIIVDKNTNKITQTVDKNYGIQVNGNELLQEVTDATLAAKIKTAHDYTLIFGVDGNVTDITVMKTIEQWQAEQTPEPSQEEILSQTVANLILENSNLKAQIQILAQTVATMQIGG
jgi:hypothetical protein